MRQQYKNQVALYRRLGIEKECKEILKRIPATDRALIEYAHSIIPYRQNSLLVFAGGSSVEKKKLVRLCAIVEALWVGALVFDDISDNDRMRYGKPSLLERYGRLATKRALNAYLNAIEEYCRDHFGNKVAMACGRSVRRAIEADSKKPGFQNTLREFIENYHKRMAFVTSFPATVMYQPGKLRQITEVALKNFQIGSLMLNDVKDWKINKKRRAGLSDIRNLVVTLPLKMLWQKLDGVGRGSLEKLFLNRNVTDSKKNLTIYSQFIKYHIPETVYKFALNYFDMSQEGFQEIVRPGMSRFINDTIRHQIIVFENAIVASRRSEA